MQLIKSVRGDNAENVTSALCGLVIQFVYLTCPCVLSKCIQTSYLSFVPIEMKIWNYSILMLVWVSFQLGL